MNIENIKRKINGLNIRIINSKKINELHRSLYKYALKELEDSFNLYISDYNENETSSFIKQMDDDTEKEILMLLNELEAELNKEGV